MHMVYYFYEERSHLLVDYDHSLYFRHDQNHEGNLAHQMFLYIRAKERVVGRTFVESVLLCCNGQ